MPSAFADRLANAILQKKSPTVIALDPVYSQLPDSIREKANSEINAISTYSSAVLRIIAAHVPVVKINSAYFERYQAAGVEAYERLVREAGAQGLIVIGDIKRGDVGHTAEMYAAAHLDGEAAPDAVTLSGYFGIDGIQPFIDLARTHGRGIFVLVRTSNPSAAAIQDSVLQDGRKVHELMAVEVARWASESGTIGRSGYSGVGAVVATRNANDAAKLRLLLPQSWLLAPGYGAQGGRAADFAPYVKADGSGALIAAGRSVIFAYQRASESKKSGADWQASVDQACRDFNADVRTLMPAGN